MTPDEGECRCCGVEIPSRTLTGLCVECYGALRIPDHATNLVMCQLHGVRVDPKHDR